MQDSHCQVSGFLTTVNEVKQRIVRLYEQGADSFRIGQYVRRWLQWVQRGCSDNRMVETEQERQEQ